MRELGEVVAQVADEPRGSISLMQSERVSNRMLLKHRSPCITPGTSGTRAAVSRQRSTISASEGSARPLSRVGADRLMPLAVA